MQRNLIIAILAALGCLGGVLVGLQTAPAQAQQGHTIPVAPPHAQHIDLRNLAIPAQPQPASGGIGTPGTWLSTAPNTIPLNGTFASAGSGFAPSEVISYTINGNFVLTDTADSGGFTPFYYFTINSQGSYILKVTGLSSGKAAASSVLVLNGAPQVPGLAVAPHALRSGDLVYLFALGYPANTSITIALDTNTLVTCMTDSNGLCVRILPISGATGAAVLNSYRPGVPGSMAGQSIEIRPDALAPGRLAPAADQNPARALVDRAVVSSTVASTLILGAEGFEPGETFSSPICGVTGTADANGAFVAAVPIPPGAAVYHCLFSGSVSGRLAYAAALADPTADNLPGALVSPSNTTAGGAATVTLWFNHLPPSMAGNVYLDGNVQGSTSTNGMGYGSLAVAKPGPGAHILSFFGTGIQAAAAPLYVLPAQGTPTPTTTPGATHTATPVGASPTPTVAVPSATSTPTTGSSSPTPTRTVTAGSPSPTPTRTATAGSSSPTPTRTATAILPTATRTTLPPTGTPPTGTATPQASPSAIRTPSATPTPGPPTSTPAPGAATGTATATAPPTMTAPAGSPTPTATECPITFSDVHPTDYFYEPVRYLYCHGVISGYGDGTFRPYNNTTRAQMVKIVVLGFGIPAQTPAGGAYTFHDVPPGAPFFDVIETAAAHSIISGYNCGPGGPGPCDPQNRPYFLPNNPVTRGQLSKIDTIPAGWPLLNPATATFTDVPPSSPFYTFVETAVCHGVISGYADHTFHPGANATRGQISKIVYLSITGPSGVCAPTATATR